MPPVTFLDLPEELHTAIFRRVVFTSSPRFGNDLRARVRALGRLRRVSRALSASESLRALAEESAHYAIDVDTCDEFASALDVYEATPTLGRHVRVVSIELGDLYFPVFDDEADLEDDLYLPDPDWMVYNLPAPTVSPSFALHKMSGMWAKRQHELALDYERLTRLCPSFEALIVDGHGAIGSLPTSCTSISLSISRPDVFPALMRRHPQLRHFEQDEGPPDEQPPDVVDMPNMRTLDIVVDWFDPAQYRAPLLRELRLSSPAGLISCSGAQELAGLADAYPQLRRPTLDGPYDDPDLLDLLPARLPSLVVWVGRSWHDIGCGACDVLRRIADGLGRSTAVPGLATLELYGDRRPQPGESCERHKSAYDAVEEACRRRAIVLKRR